MSKLCLKVFLAGSISFPPYSYLRIWGGGVPFVGHQVPNPAIPWRCRFSPWPLSVIRIQHCCELRCYGVGCRRSLDLALLWLWCRPAAATPIEPPTWGPLYAASPALKRAKEKSHCWVSGDEMSTLLVLSGKVISWASCAPQPAFSCLNILPHFV